MYISYILFFYFFTQQKIFWKFIKLSVDNIFIYLKTLENIIRIKVYHVSQKKLKLHNLIYLTVNEFRCLEVGILTATSPAPRTGVPQQALPLAQVCRNKPRPSQQVCRNKPRPSPDLCQWVPSAQHSALAVAYLSCCEEVVSLFRCATLTTHVWELNAACSPIYWNAIRFYSWFNPQWTLILWNSSQLIYISINSYILIWQLNLLKYISRLIGLCNIFDTLGKLSKSRYGTRFINWHCAGDICQVWR